MFLRIQRQLRRNPTCVVTVTLVFWWFAAVIFVFLFRNDFDHESDSGESYSLESNKAINPTDMRANFKKGRLSRRERYNLVRKGIDESPLGKLDKLTLKFKENVTLPDLKLPQKTGKLNMFVKKRRKNRLKINGSSMPTDKKRMYRKRRQLSTYNGGIWEGRGLNINTTSNVLLNHVGDVLVNSGESPSKMKLSNKSRVQLQEDESIYSLKREVTSHFLRTLVTIVCNTDQKPDPHLRNIFQRQLNQTKTMLKSLVYFSSASFRVIVVTESQKTYDQVLSQLEDWPERYRSRLHFERGEIWIPKQENILMEVWRPCSWPKLFLHEALPNLDAAIYVDTDILFLGPAEGLWDVLEGLQEPQAFAIGQDPLYDRHKHRRYAGTVGLSAGLFGANFTRLRSFKSEHGRYSDTIMHYKKNNKNSHDQDTLNVLLADYPAMFHELSPQWIFCPSHCLQGVLPCCLDTGVNVIHGFDATFVRGVEMVFQVIYEALLNFELGSPASLLREGLDKEFFRVDRLALSSACRKVMGIQTVLTKHIRDLADLEGKGSTLEWYNEKTNKTKNEALMKE
ncbi:glucoside xylosyltransferase 1-like [Macrobrachium nipponense]|uniref:glucoside xylosyltransferase 1-like n=1 Tax=Macrobrachium nipponense TaxID=159736 RepID=UPI0030C87E06